MKQVTQILGDYFVHACTFDETYGYEKFVPESLLAFQLSGETRIYHQRGEMVLEEGQVLLARKNQFAKSIKVPPKGKEYQCISVLLTDDRLRQFALDNGISCEEKYTGKKNIVLEPNSFLQGYLLSLLPYVEQWRNVNKKLAAIKVTEAIELLLHLHPDLKSFLFDFSDPNRADLEEFMLKNFHFNAPIEQFAKLSGRSLSGFKREFVEIFDTSPATWLKSKRLSEAFYLIKQKGKKPQDIYLELGFENLSHFYTSFKQKYGITPAGINQK
jgi:AraC family transcriptional regulator, exoenzyme S synthesis regulatory protein ExsA